MTNTRNAALATQLAPTMLPWPPIATRFDLDREYRRAAPDGQVTIVTERTGRLHGLRVVRGREAECARFYEAAAIVRRPHAARGVAS